MVTMIVTQVMCCSRGRPGSPAHTVKWSAGSVFHAALTIGTATFHSYSQKRLPISVAANNEMRRHLIVNKHEVCKTNERNEKNCTARGTANNTVKQCSHQKRAKKTKKTCEQSRRRPGRRTETQKKGTVSSTDCDSAKPTLVLTGNVPQVMDKYQSSQTRTGPTTRRERG